MQMQRELEDTIKSPFFCVRKFLMTESPIKMMKNAFSSTLRGHFLGYLHFCSDFLAM